MRRWGAAAPLTHTVLLLTQAMDVAYRAAATREFGERRTDESRQRMRLFERHMLFFFLQKDANLGGN